MTMALPAVTAGQNGQIKNAQGAAPLFEHAIGAIQGGRNYQEDTAKVWPGESRSIPSGAGLPAEAGALIAVLADGMGGHVAGALASQTICQAFVETYAAGEGGAIKRLQAALDAGNDGISQKVQADADLAGMGTTAVGVALGGFGLHWISVGDSPLYLWRAGRLEQLNADHSLGGLLDKMAELGEISPAQALSDPRRHLLRSAITGGKMDLIDISQVPRPLLPGDVILLASDGIQTLAPGAIAQLIGGHHGLGATAIADTLLAAVEAEGAPYQDNATLIAICVSAQAGS